MSSKIYLVVGYDLKKTIDVANVYIYACFDNELDAKKAQIKLSGGVIKECFKDSKAYYGGNGFCSWINEINLNEYCKLDARQPN